MASSSTLRDRGFGGVGPALCEPKQGEPRLRLTALATRLPVGAFRSLEVAAAAMNLSLPVARLAGGRVVQGLPAALLSALCLHKRVRPVSAQLKELRAVDEAAAGEGDQIRLALAPPRQCCGPLLGAADLVGVPARQDHTAVDDAGHDR